MQASQLALETILQQLINTPTVGMCCSLNSLRTQLTRLHLDASFRSFMADDFLRVLLLRHIFCYTTLHLHKITRSRGPGGLPISYPILDSSIIHCPAVIELIRQIALLCGVQEQFHGVE